MATVTEIAPPQSTAEVEPYRMTAATFLKAVDADVFPEKDKVFLLNGRIYIKMGKRLPHSTASGSVLYALLGVLPGGWGVWPENPILTGELSAPLPDLCVIRGMPQDYYQRGSIPKAEDVVLVIEIASSSLHLDRTDALVNYAAAGLPVYWIVNLIDWQVEVYSSPKTVEGVARYATQAIYPVGRDVPVVIDGVEVAQLPAGRILPGERRLDP